MPVQCTEAEWKIMAVLWEDAPRTMPEITRALAPSTGWSRHTVITLLKRMQDKGAVSVDEGGPVKRYTPLITREEGSSHETKKLLSQVYAGKASLLVQNLVDSGELTIRDVEELLDLIRREGKE